MNVERTVNGVFKGAFIIIILNVVILGAVIFGVVSGCNYVRKKGLKNIGQALMEGTENTENTNSTLTTSE